MAKRVVAEQLPNGSWEIREYDGDRLVCFTTVSTPQAAAIAAKRWIES